MTHDVDDDAALTRTRTRTRTRNPNGKALLNQSVAEGLLEVCLEDVSAIGGSAQWIGAPRKLWLTNCKGHYISLLSLLLVQY